MATGTNEAGAVDAAEGVFGSSVHVSLHSDSDPGDAGSGELSNSWYGRQEIGTDDRTISSEGIVTNDAAIDWGTPTDVATVRSVCIRDGTAAGAAVLATYELPAALVVSTTVALTIPAGLFRWRVRTI